LTTSDGRSFEYADAAFSSRINEFKEASMAIAQVGQDDWQSMVLDSKAPVLVDFYATWCGPCKMISPMLDELSHTYAGKVRFCKVDIDQAPDVASKYAVSGVPTLVVFKAGEEMDRKVGAVPKPALESWLGSQIEHE
jgi:thioredoxin